MARTYVLLIRGINVGGRNKVPMANLKNRLEELGYSRVATYLASGNVILRSAERPDDIKARVEEALSNGFEVDSELVKVLVLSLKQLQAVVANKPKGFGEQPKKYHSDAIFLMGIDAVQAMAVFNPREGVDKVWPGSGVIYSQRLSARRTRSRLSKITTSALYKAMTVRSWSTTMNLLDVMTRIDAAERIDAAQAEVGSRSM